jgi:hypothetical protein
VSKLAIAYAAAHWGNVINGGGTQGVSTGFFSTCFFVQPSSDLPASTGLSAQTLLLGSPHRRLLRAHKRHHLHHRVTPPDVWTKAARFSERPRSGGGTCHGYGGVKQSTD